MEAKVESLISGMVINQNIYDKHNVLIVPKGTLITDHIIMHLLKFGVLKADASDNWVQDRVLNEFDKTYAHTLEKIKDVFEDVKQKQNIDISQFDLIMDELLDKSESSWSILPYMRVIEKKDDYTFHHSINVSILAMLMGKWLGYEREDRRLLGIAAVLHDIGKVLIPIEILNKPGTLTSTEYSMMKEHAKFGFDILNNSDSIGDSIKHVVLYHHERMNGSGYPFGLHGSRFDEKAKIVGICDVYDAVTSKRVYKDKVSPLKGLKIILDGSYDILDPYLSRVFLDNVAKTYHGCKALLNDERVCKIIRIFPENPTRPWIAVDGKLYDLAECSDLEIVDII